MRTTSVLATATLVLGGPLPPVAGATAAAPTRPAAIAFPVVQPATIQPSVVQSARVRLGRFEPERDDEGGSRTLRQALESAAKGHIDAQARLDNSRRRQLLLSVELAKNEAALAVLLAQVAEVAGHRYRLGRISGMSMLLDSGGQDDFLARTVSLDLVGQQDDKQLNRLAEAKHSVSRAKAAIDAEVRVQARQVAVMAWKKKVAERALLAAGGGADRNVAKAKAQAKAKAKAKARPAATKAKARTRAARPAQKRSDGSWSKESCSLDDTTTSGCVTPRTMHALKEAKSAGFERYVSCFRSGGGGEHPKGRACDFAAAPDGFENHNAGGDDRAYGNKLAEYFVENAGELGVLYVIWYREIWLPGSGWKSYSGGGSPAASHTNHVHVSIY